MPYPPKNLNQFASLVQVIADLRGPDGCPWDKEQTHQSLVQYAIEETYEMVEAIEQRDDPHICEELGDVLFQVVLHAQLAKDRGAFSIEDVIESITAKIVRRHPHVFAGVKVTGIEQIFENWDQIKAAEKVGTKSAAFSKSASAFDVPLSLPALQRAAKIGAKTRKLKFDWGETREVLTQLKAEIIELEQAMNETSSESRDQHLNHEMGDVLFSAAQVARHLGIDPEGSLREANRRFANRFTKMLELGAVDKTGFTNLSPSEKEELWRKAKLVTD